MDHNYAISEGFCSIHQQYTVRSQAQYLGVFGTPFLWGRFSTAFARLIYSFWIINACFTSNHHIVSKTVHLRANLKQYEQEEECQQHV